MFECLGGGDFSLTLGSYMELGGPFEVLLVTCWENGVECFLTWMLSFVMIRRTLGKSFKAQPDFKQSN